MPLIADRVVETSTSTGIGSISLDGPDLDHEAFSDAFATAAEVFYVISQTGTAWEVGIGTLTHGVPDTLSRDTVLSSSNGDALVNFGAGIKNVFNVPPAGLFAPLVLDPSGTVRFDFDKGADIASAATTDIGAATGNSVDITGAATITDLGTAKAGATRRTRTTGTPTFTHDPVSLILPGGANIVAVAGDVQDWLSLGAGDWLCANYQPVSGEALVTTPIASQAEMEAVTAINRLVTPGRMHHHPGVAKAWVTFTVTAGAPAINVDYGVTSITDNGVGDFSFNFDTNFSTIDYVATGGADRGSGADFMMMVNSGGRAVGSCRMLCLVASIASQLDPVTDGWAVFFGDH